MQRPAVTASKPQWRRWAKHVRSRLPLARLGDEVVGRIQAWPRYHEVQHILTYWAFGSELDLSALQKGSKMFYLTRIWNTGKNLTLHPVTGELERHPFGYFQPKGDAPHVAPELIDLVLVPGLCFDQKGNRLGYGGGFYDRLLPELRAEVPRIGITAQELVVPTLPRGGFDVPVTHLATQAGVSVVAR